MQLRLEGIDAPRERPRLRPATVLLGRYWVAECRAILADAETPPAPSKLG